MNLSWWWCLPLGLGAALGVACRPIGRLLGEEAARTETMAARLMEAARRRATLEDDRDTPSSGG